MRFHPKSSKLGETKNKDFDGIQWNIFSHLPLHSIINLLIQTMEAHYIPLGFILVHPKPPIQT